MPVLAPMAVGVDDSYFGGRTWTCIVESARNVSTLIREIVLSLPEGDEPPVPARDDAEDGCDRHTGAGGH